jgi:cysteine desulfurase family protein
MYLDNAATSFPKPECVAAAVEHWLRHGAASAGRGSHRAAEDAVRLVDDTRRRMAALIGTHHPEQAVWTFNGTDSLSTVLNGFLRPGDRVLASTLDHNSVLRPLRALQQQRDLVVEYIEFDPLTGELDVEEFERRLRGPAVRLVVLNHASNVTGTVQPIERMAALAASHGAAVLIDAAQTLGHEPLSVDQLPVDFVAAPGHKGLLGPLGTGVLWIRPGREQELLPLRYGGTGTASESLEQPSTMPARFESGNLNLPGIAGLSAALEWLAAEGLLNVRERVNSLTVQLASGLRDIPGVNVMAPQSPSRCGLVSFTISGLDCRDAAMILDQSFDIQCRAGLHCAPLAHRRLGTLEQGGTMRFSPGVFTTTDDIDRAIAAIHQIAASVR